MMRKCCSVPLRRTYAHMSSFGLFRNVRTILGRLAPLPTRTLSTAPSWNDFVSLVDNKDLQHARTLRADDKSHVDIASTRSTRYPYAMSWYSYMTMAQLVPRVFE